MERIITSPQNPAIKRVLKLRRAGQRKEKNLILIEGFKEISLAVSSGIIVETLFYSPFLARSEQGPEKIMNQSLIKLGPEAFKKISYREHPDGFLALARPRYLKLKDLVLNVDSLVVVLEAVEKPGNLGAVLRTADAVGVDAVLFCESQTDVYNPNVIRASLGAVFSVPVVVCDSAAVLRWLKEKNFKIYSTTPRATIYYTEVDYTGGRTAIAVGVEHVGLSSDWLEAGEKIKIPLRGRADSLNVSVSAAIVLFEVLRQRKGGK